MLLRHEGRRGMGEMNKKKDLTVVIAIVCAAVLAAVVFGIAAHGISSRRETPDTSIGGSTLQPDPTVKTTDSASAPDASDSEPVTAPPTEKNTQTVPEPPTTESPDTLAPFVPDTDYRYQNLPESAPAELSALSKSVFVGDSRTEGLALYTRLPSSGARIYTHVGMSVKEVFSDKVIKVGGQNMTVIEALKSDPTFDRVYIMLGVNELGWIYTEAFIEKYGEIIDTVRTINPNAKIIVQSLIPVSADAYKTDPLLRNSKIEEYNKALDAMCRDKNVWFLNVAEMFSGNGGVLPADASNDGVHLKKAYCDHWLDYILSHMG